MTQNWRSSYWKLTLASAFFIGGAFAFFGNRTLAQPIIPDATLGVEPSVVTSDVDVGGVPADRIEGGAVRGTNLFHSFAQFNVGELERVYFANPLGIINILSRVTGNNPSNILGTLGVTGGNANLFLINPNGIIFGPNSRLDIGGSFFASTASSFKFPDGSEFSATNPTAPPLLTVNITPGLQWGASKPGATITNRGNLAPRQDLTLVADKLDLQGQLQAGRDLRLLAQDTVWVRDSVTTPFLAQADGNLTVQGNDGIDILALNHPTQTPFVSGGNLSLISDGVISGDAHFSSGGSFSIKSVSGGLANFVSFYDPIISADGDVDVAANYTGTSLLVEATGNIRFQGDINITGPDISTLPDGPDTATLSSSSALILRSGQSALAYGGVNSGSVPAYGTGSVLSGITLGGAVTLQPFNASGAIVSLSAGAGNVSTQGITTNGGAININSAGAITTNGKTLDTTNGGNNGGDITLSGNGNIATGILDSSSYSFDGTGNGGAISISATNGSITTGDLDSSSFSGVEGKNNGGDITLSGNGNISTGILDSSSYSFEGTGNGGAITLSTSNGNITTDDLDSYSRGAGENGGAISLSATNGNITTGDLDSSSRSYYSFSSSDTAGNGGAISLSALGGINTGNLFSYSYSSVATVGNGGAISLSATNGNITTGSLFSDSFSKVSTAGNGGTISLSTSNGNIIAGNLNSHSESFYGTSGNGGAISISTSNGNISTGSLSSYSSSFGTTATGNGGAISLSATNGITTENLNSSSYSLSDSGIAGNGGAISLSATNGTITTSDLLSLSFSVSGSAAQGGNISLFANNSIQLFREEYDLNTNTYKRIPGSLINSTGVLGSGNINIVSNAPLTLYNSVISSDTFGSGRGGAIHISAPSISLTNGAQLSASTHSSGQGGNITLRASDKLELNGAITDPLFLFPPTGLAGIPPGTFLGGFIPTGDAQQLSPKGTLFPSGVFTQTTVGSTGSAGNISIETGRLLVKDGAAIATTTFGQDRAGNISVQAKDSISVANGSILSGVAGEARGDSGNIELQTRSLSITGGGLVQTQTLGEGKAGDIQARATDSVSLSGDGSGLRSGSGGSNTLLGTTGSNIGQGGNISVTTGSLSLDDRAVLDAQTQTNSKGGNITVNANTLSTVNGGRLLTSTSGGGQAGDITVSAKEIQLSGSNSGLFAQTSSAANAGNLTLQPLAEGQTLTVDFFDGAQISASTNGSGQGGTLTITAPESITLSGNGSIISAETTGSGTGGDLTLQTGTLTVRDEAKVTVSSTGTGNAGNLDITANLVLLDNGELIAQTASGEGGNIYLRVEDLLSMRNNSLISAQAGNNGNGGNIDIDGQLIVAVKREDSDIVADADRGNGGNINITTQGIFGLEYRNQRTPESDITASSRFGISGTVNIARLATDPSQGLTNLPTEVVDASNQIAQNCRAGGAAASEQSSFVVTGRGGLPPNPKEALSPDAVEVDLVRRNSDVEERSALRSSASLSRRDVPTNSTRPAPTQLVEAQGWVINDKGEVVLTATAPTITPHSSWHKPVDCRGLQSQRAGG